MCNACGFQCCAYDGFSRCGCDDCHEPACHSVCDCCELPLAECTCGEFDDADVDFGKPEDLS